MFVKKLTTIFLVLFAIACNPHPAPLTTPSPSPASFPPLLPVMASAPPSAPTSTTTSTPTVAPTLTPTTTPTMAPAATSLPPLFEALMKPFVEEAQRRRHERARNEPDYAKKIDVALNENRVNFLFFCWGETHEPPLTEKGIVGSHTIVSYDYRQRELAIISLTHDLRAPEVERLAHPNSKSSAMRLDQAYLWRKDQALNRLVLENATGLAIDFQIFCRESAIQRLVDEVFNGVEVEVETTFQVHPFYLDGQKYPAATFPAGRQKLNGTQVLQFIKTVPVSSGYYGKNLEHNSRKAVVFKGLAKALENQSQNREFWLKAWTFAGKEAVSGNLSVDSPLAMFTSVLMAGAELAGNKNAFAGSGLPEIKKSLYVVDPCCGDGGVQWVSANAAVNPLTQKDISESVYQGLDFEVPVGANPYGDLVTEYWGSVRQLVKKFLLGQ